MIKMLSKELLAITRFITYNDTDAGTIDYFTFFGLGSLFVCFSDCLLLKFRLIFLNCITQILDSIAKAFFFLLKEGG